MASISEQKFREMEAEMSRFEQEISVPKPSQHGQHDSSKVIIGASTYSKVQRQLAAIASGGAPPPPPPPMRDGPPRVPGPGRQHAPPGRVPAPGTQHAPPGRVPAPGTQHALHGRLPAPGTQNAPPGVSLPMSVASAPPPPPPPGPAPIRPSSALPNLPPPPPPPPIVNAKPSFIPHQLRARAPPPPPPPPQQQFQQPPMGMPPRPLPMSRPPGPPMMGPGPGGHQMGPPRPGMPRQGAPQYRAPPPYSADMGNYYGSPQQTRPQTPVQTPAPVSTGVIEKPKVVYSSGPVRAKKPKIEDSNSSTSAAASTAAESGPSTTAASAAAAKAGSVIPGIELNVPVEHVKMEKSVDMESEIDGEPVVPTKKEKKEKKKKFVRTAAGQVWEDQSLSEWDQDDFRIFCGDLGNEVTDEVLARAFSKYPSFQKSKIVRDRRTNKTRGFGFVSFKDPNDFVKAMREMNGKYVGNRPIKLRKSTWKERQIDIVKRKDKEKKRLGLK